MSNDEGSTTKRKRSGGRRVFDKEGNLLARVPPTKPRKPLGRPKKKPEPGTMVTTSLRVSAELKTKLDLAADDSDRSQSEEAARRLAASFELQPIKDIMMVVNVIDGGRWHEEPAKADLVIELVETYLRSLLSDECRAAMNASVGTKAAEALSPMLEKIAELKETADRWWE